MKAGGCEAQTIAGAEARLERGIAAEQLCKVIEDAFDGVVLGGGVGLQEAQGIDDYKDEATCAAYRAGDEKDDWRKIAAEALNVCNSSLSFFDAAGMRFHLPAYLICELRGDYRFHMAFCLTQTYQTIPEKFSLLNRQQRTAVRTYSTSWTIRSMRMIVPTLKGHSMNFGQLRQPARLVSPCPEHRAAEFFTSRAIVWEQRQLRPVKRRGRQLGWVPTWRG